MNKPNIGVPKRLTIAQKILIIGVLGTVLTAVPTWLFVRQVDKEIATSSRESEGIAPVNKFLRVTQLVQQHRGLSAAVLGGNLALSAQRDAKRAETDQAFADYEALIAADAVPKPLQDALIPVKADWKSLSAAVNDKSINVKASYARHTALAGAMLGVIGTGLDHFGLSLDPEADTYYLIMSVYVHIPYLGEALGQARAKGTGMLALKQAAPEDRVAMASIVERAQDRLDNGLTGLNKAVSFNPGLKEKLAAVTADAEKQATGALKLTLSEIVTPSAISFESGSYYTQYTNAIDAQYKLIETGATELAATLAGRTAQQISHKRTLLGLVLALAALAAAFGWWVARSLIRQLGGEPSYAAEAVQRISGGDLHTEIAVRPGAEQSLLGDMRTMLGQLRDREVADADSRGQIAAISRGQAVIEFKLDGTVLTANDNFLNTLGYSLDEIKGRHHSMLAEPVYAASSEYKQFWDKLNRGEFDAGQYKCFGKGGREIWIQASYNPIMDMNGKPFKVVKYATDVTAQVHAAEALSAAVKQTQAAIAAALSGDLTSQIPMEGKSGAIEALCANVNALIGNINGTVKEAQASIAAALAGDLTARIAMAGKTGAFEVLCGDINGLVDNMMGVMIRIRNAADVVNTGSSEIAAGNQDLSQRTEEQAASLQQTASSMEQITQTVKQNAENSKQANQLAIGASEVATKGGAVVAQVVQTMASINESSKKIVDIISVIDGIAFQTNILALNAAVEAARAGDQGRGFAVVASEVRSLAQRSASAAKEIKALIGDSVEKVGTGTKLVESAGKTMDDVVASVKRVSDIIAEITSASMEQSTGIEQVGQAITQMDQVTQQNAALVEQSAAAAESMRDQAGALSQVVSAFTVNDAGGQAAAAKPVVAKPAAVRPAAVRPAATKPAAARPAAAKRATAASTAKATATAHANGEEWEEF